MVLCESDGNFFMKMNYFVFGTNNMEKAVAFYDAIFKIAGVNKIHSQGRMTLWAGQDFMFAIAEPFNGEIATNGNGTMIGFNLSSSQQVEELYEKALSIGGENEGTPGMRSGRFSAYVRDLDKNKICLFS